jgi:hypothetical protein
MIKHVAMFKLRDKSPENMKRALTAIESLREGIDGLRSLEVGADFAGTGVSYDVIGIVCFNDRDGLDAYLKHPQHRAVAALMRELSVGVAIVDYESS